MHTGSAYCSDLAATSHNNDCNPIGTSEVRSTRAGLQIMYTVVWSYMVATSLLQWPWLATPSCEEHTVKKAAENLPHTHNRLNLYRFHVVMYAHGHNLVTTSFRVAVDMQLQCHRSLQPARLHTTVHRNIKQESILTSSLKFSSNHAKEAACWAMCLQRGTFH